MVICLVRDADLHMAQLMPLPLTVSCFSKIQIGFTFLVPPHPGSPRKRAVKQVCVCVCKINKLRPDGGHGTIFEIELHPLIYSFVYFVLLNVEDDNT